MSGTSVVVVKDHVQSIVMTLVYGAAHKEDIASRFDEPDNLLAKLQGQREFRGLYTLGDLDPSHFRTLIGLHLGLVADLPPEKRRVPTNPIMRSFDILILGFLICLERRMQGAISMMHINRTQGTVLFDLNASLDDYELMKTPKPGLRVVVDRT